MRGTPLDDQDQKRRFFRLFNLFWKGASIASFFYSFVRLKIR
ncbi:hypothetical protein BRO54_0859 [Geobacillus proteiniphilus]|uniref:Uncharacterized protein n=1 Tax=Geobacillus proteiniphilus TaxID=860353 RepID=A0A1Q5T5B3_9BACL|nr:hypothetical protein BRO54_0859 [Geobacillus proteiniphilus]